MKKFLGFIILLIVTNISIGDLSAPGHLASAVIDSNVDEALQITSTPPNIILPV